MGGATETTVVCRLDRHIIAMRKGFYLLLGSMTQFVTNILARITNLLWVFVGLDLFWIYAIFPSFLMVYTYYIVTDQRIRQIAQHGFLVSVIELKLSRIQNISYSIGVLAECLSLVQ